MRWIIAPLAAAFLLAGSAWLHELDATTTASARLAEASRSAPSTTRAAARDVSTLPALARLTHRQAISFRALAAALQASSTRVEKLNGSLRRQVTSLHRLRSSIASFGRYLTCARERLGHLVTASGEVPGKLASIAATIDTLTRLQDAAILHMKSINHKLALLGIAATASGVEVPAAPSGSSSPRPGAGPAAVSC